jgi:hypothetical protein
VNIRAQSERLPAVRDSVNGGSSVRIAIVSAFPTDDFERCETGGLEMNPQTRSGDPRNVREGGGACRLSLRRSRSVASAAEEVVRKRGRPCERDQRRRDEQAELLDLHQGHDTEAFSAALFVGTFLIPLSHRTGGVRIPQDAQLIENVRRKASSAASATDEQFIEVDPQTFRVRPHGRDQIGDARIQLAKRVWLDSTRQSVEPCLGARQKECNWCCSTLPREVDRNFRPG